MRAIISNFQDAEHFESMEKICKKITAKDVTFQYMPNPNELTIELYSQDKNVLHKKASWIIYKADSLKKTVYHIYRD